MCRLVLGKGRVNENRCTMNSQNLLISIPEHHIINASIIAMKQDKSLYDVILQAINIGIKQLQADVYQAPSTNQMVDDPSMDLSIKNTISEAKEKLDSIMEDYSFEEITQDREVSIMSDGSFEV